MPSLIVFANSTLRGLGIALLFSIGGFLASLVGGALWLFIVEKRTAGTAIVPTLDLALYTKHVSIPIAVVIFIVTFLVFKRK